MPSERELVDAYTRRALLLLRVAGGFGADATAELRALAKDLRALLADADLPALGRRDFTTLLREIEAAIVARYGVIAAAQIADLSVLLGTEAAWAAQTGALPRTAGTGAIDAAAAGLLVMGLKVDRQWARQATNLSDRILAAVRTAQATAQAPPDLLATVIGQGARGRERGGIMESARQQAATLADTSAHAAAYAGRQAAWKAGGVRYLKWHAILDSRTTINCATRAGKVYTLDFQPVGHDIPMGAPPPAHWNCRSILVAMTPDYEPPGDGQDPYSESLDDWLKRHPEAMQDEMLGPTRAGLWRAGKLDARGLLGPGGETLSVAELARILPDDAKVMLWTGEAKYQRIAGELTPGMRQAGATYGLDEHHMVAIRHYTQDGYEAMNAALHQGRDGPSTVAVGVLNDALSRLPAYDGPVVRRVTMDAEALAKHVPGSIVDYPAFTSATRGTSDVFEHRPHRLIIDGKTGRDISQWSAYRRSELEVLFGVPRSFVVRDRRAVGGEIWIWLREVNE